MLMQRTQQQPATSASSAVGAHAIPATATAADALRLRQPAAGAIGPGGGSTHVLKEGYLQAQATDDSWQDVKLTLLSTMLVAARRRTGGRLVSAGAGAVRQGPSFDRHRLRPRAPVEEGVRQPVVMKLPGESLGFGVRGGERGLPIIIASLKEGGPAALSQSVFVGDQLLAVEGIAFDNISHDEAVEVLVSMRSKSAVRLSVCFNEDAHLLLNQMDMLTPTADNVPQPDTDVIPAGVFDEVMKIPLSLCSVSKWQDNDSAPSLRPMESFSVRGALDISKELILRAPGGNRAIAKEWMDAIQSARDQLPCLSLRKPDPPAGFTGLVVKLLRVHEKLIDGSWRDLFMAITDHDVTFFHTPPTHSRDLSDGIASYPLLVCRYRSGPRALREGEPLLDRRERSEGCFCLRLPNGVRHYLSAGTLDAETSVAHTMAERTRQVVRATKAISYAAFWQGETVALTIDWHSGLWLNRDYRGDKSMIWHRPFTLLRKTADEPASKTLVLGFADTKEPERLQVDNPSMVVFVLTAFLDAHLHGKQTIDGF